MHSSASRPQVREIGAHGNGWCILNVVPHALPHLSSGDDHGGLVEELTTILASTHLVWSHPDERRRMRFFGFRPAVEPSVLKREWHGITVRVDPDRLRALWPDGGELEFRAADRAMLFDGAPFRADDRGMALMQHVLDLIQAYERWVEAREGKSERISRGRVDGRAVNPLAETRRFQRAMQVRRRTGR